MNIINISRGDLSTLYHSPSFTVPGMGNTQTDASYAGVFNNYMQELNAYYQSDQYLQLAQELTNLRPTENLDITIYLINSDDMSVGKLMQQYIMASPYVARAYDEGLIAGYTNGFAKDYLMPYEDRVRYGEVMDGILEEGDDDMMYSTEYISDTEENHNLDLEDQSTVMHSWDYIRNKIISGVDPTS